MLFCPKTDPPSATIHKSLCQRQGLGLLLAVYKEMLQWVSFYTDFGCVGVYCLELCTIVHTVNKQGRCPMRT